MRKALRQRKQVTPDPGGLAIGIAGGVPPRRLPPLPEGGDIGTGQPFSSIQQASITNATFTLTPEGSGVATFEFRSLFPLPSQQGATSAGAGAREATPPPAVESGAGAHRRQGLSSRTPSPTTRVDKAKKQTTGCVKGLRTFLQTVSIIVTVTVLGNLVFSWLETETENQTRAQYTQHMLALRDKYNISSADFQDVLNRIGTPLHFDESSETRNWGVTNSNSALFVFTIVSTIGYGNIAPQTDSGKVFLMVYAAIGIPIVTTCVGSLAAQFLSFVEWWAVARMDVVETAFNFYDTDRSGQLDEDELFRALQDLQIHLSREEIRAVVGLDDKGA
jgi:hypothetical protein